MDSLTFLPQGDVNVEGLALQPDGRIVVGCDSSAAGLHFLAVRLNPATRPRHPRVLRRP